jgi:hypothetical protein
MAVARAGAMQDHFYRKNRFACCLPLPGTGVRRGPGHMGGDQDSWDIGGRLVDHEYMIMRQMILIQLIMTNGS